MHKNIAGVGHGLLRVLATWSLQFGCLLQCSARFDVTRRVSRDTREKFANILCSVAVFLFLIVGFGDRIKVYRELNEIALSVFSIDITTWHTAH